MEADIDSTLYYVYEHPTGPTVVCAQWFDMFDYDDDLFMEKSEWGTPIGHSTEEEAEDAMIEVLKNRLSSNSEQIGLAVKLLDTLRGENDFYWSTMCEIMDKRRAKVDL